MEREGGEGCLDLTLGQRMWPGIRQPPCGCFGGDVGSGRGGSLRATGGGAEGSSSEGRATGEWLCLSPDSIRRLPAGATQSFSDSTQGRPPCPPPACTRHPHHEIEFTTDSNTFKSIYCKITFQ